MTAMFFEEGMRREAISVSKCSSSATPWMCRQYLAGGGRGGWASPLLTKSEQIDTRITHYPALGKGTPTAVASHIV